MTSGRMGCADCTRHPHPPPTVCTGRHHLCAAAAEAVQQGAPLCATWLLKALTLHAARQVPTNGLVLYTGTILTDEGKEKKVNIDFEPFKTINTSLYLCDNKFHTEALSELLESENKYGFIIMDGNGTLFGTLSGNTREARPGSLLGQGQSLSPCRTRTHRSCTSSPSTCPRSTAAAVSQRCVSRACVWRSATTTSERCTHYSLRSRC